MRIVVLVARAGDQRACLDQRLDHRLVGVAELALVVDHALAVEARRVLGEEAGLVDGEGDLGVDAARFERGAVLFPDLEVLGAVAGRGMHEARAGVLGDMLAGEQRHVEIVAAARCSGCAAQDAGEHQRWRIDERPCASSSTRAQLAHASSASASASTSLSPGLAQLSSGASVTS